MRALLLIRVDHNDLSTFGYISDEKLKSICMTLEPSAADRLVAGTYTARRRVGEQYDTFELNALDGEMVAFKIGNTPGETAGAILLGSNYGIVAAQHGVTESPAAFRWFMDALRDVDVFELTITDPDPTPFAANHVAEDA